MAINTIHYDDSLDLIWSVLVYEEARLLKDRNASDLASEAGALVERWTQVNTGQRSAWRAEIVAQAGIDAEDDMLDDTVDELDNELLRTFRDRDAPQRKRYFKKARHEIVRLGLESEIEVVRAWPASLKTEGEPALQALGARLEGDIARGDAAVEERQRAAAATADQRVREIVRFVDDINAARRTRYGLLIQRAEERRLPKDWPGRFFKKSTQGPKKVKSAPAVENPPA
ncbi:hypothetical protein ACSRUE_07835 [Sorangium sp. KYC3313]|uniref:Uncharacterized protein n=1 Tax=Sorangium cellulosum (strain So ce56) TaxID=448385 RepID=A9FMD5_SORC5|nr:hypothetical protein [Sorangium cellulosum]CAN98319.1 hypothetical protein predicted by Glimmer/Critica [Sorangium cellulosum So ce56]